MADVKKKPKKKEPPVLTPEGLRMSAQKQIQGAALALDFRDQAQYYEKAAALLQSIPDDPESAALAEKYRKKSKEILETGWKTAYQAAQSAKEAASTPEEFSQAASAFQKLSGYQDADQQEAYCQGQYRRLSHRRKPGFFVALLLIVLVLVVAITYQTNWGKYQFGQLCMYSSHYSRAMNTFLDLEDYGDSAALAEDARYQLAAQHLEHGKYNKAVYHFRKLGNYKDSSEKLIAAEQALLAQAQIGDVVPFGSQEWLMLDHSETDVLLLQKDPLTDAPAYHREAVEITWVNSNLCRWLEQTYCTDTFSALEAQLLSVKDAESKVFLLSTQEVAEYNESLQTTNYNWWLCTPGNTPGCAAFVAPSGAVMEYGYSVTSAEISVRPAIWVSSQK